MKEFLDNLIEEGKIFVIDSEFSKDILREAYKYAYENSTDTTTKNGAVIVRDQNIVSRGTNTFAENVEITEKRNTAMAERVYQDHSERNAIYQAARLGIPLEDTDIYTTWIPCPVCANAIINSGIKRVVFHYESAIKPHKEWENDLKEAIKLMLESGIVVETYKGRIGNVQGLFNKEKWEP
jgi:dCMP deaminase